MAKYGYSSRVNENMAKTVGRSLPISTKHSIEVCNFIRNKDIEKAKSSLEKVAGKKLAIPFRRSTEAGHKKKIGPGKYPIKTCKEILKLLNEIEANAQYKGLSGSLKIVHISAQKSSTPWHFGRKRRRKMKRTNIEVIVEEVKKAEKKEVKKKKEIKKIETKKKDIKEKIKEKEPEKKDINDIEKQKMEKSEERVVKQLPKEIATQEMGKTDKEIPKKAKEK